MAGKFAGLSLAEAPVKMTILNPTTGEPLKRRDGEECWIEGFASQSKRGQEIDREQTTKALRRRVPRMSARDLDEGVAEKLGKLTTGWSLALLDGTPIDEPWSPENAIELFTDTKWLRDQWASWVNDLGNFQPSPSPTS
jgi:hypothetical protein